MVRVARYVAAYLVPLGGLDALVFTGGIGERSPVKRARIMGEPPLQSPSKQKQC